jgi:hypothetical protein
LKCGMVQMVATQGNTPDSERPNCCDSLYLFDL